MGLDEDENELVELRDSRKQLVTKRALKFLTLSFVSVEESVFASQSFSDLFFFIFHMMPEKTEVSTRSMGSNNVQVNAISYVVMNASCCMLP